MEGDRKSKLLCTMIFVLMVVVAVTGMPVSEVQTWQQDICSMLCMMFMFKTFNRTARHAHPTRPQEYNCDCLLYTSPSPRDRG
eukprot:4212264-Amphidinium_carterae.1